MSGALFQLENARGGKFVSEAGEAAGAMSGALFQLENTRRGSLWAKRASREKPRVQCPVRCLSLRKWCVNDRDAGCRGIERADSRSSVIFVSLQLRHA